MLNHASTIFLSAFLLFQVQPIIARYILPWYGGSPAVWTTCMLFFQLGLLGGYAYAHLIRRFTSRRTQGLVHFGLLAASLLALPVTPGEGWKPTALGTPVGGILELLFWTVGFPYFLVSATGPLVQHWFSNAYPNRSPYRLYALSNLGSLLGLLAYPFLVEVFLPLRSQTLLWSAGYVLYAVLCAWCAIRSTPNSLLSEPGASSAGSGSVPVSGSRGDRLLWLLLAACGSVALLATTNQLCQDVAVVPFLWVLPLCVYLTSFIICFDREKWYDRRVWVPVLLLSVVGVLYLMHASVGQIEPDLLLQIVIYSLVLLACCMVCHGELVRIKPPARDLTSFYLVVAAGGALGGLFVSLAAPVLFSGYWEFPLVLVAVLALLGFCLFRRRDGLQLSSARFFARQAWIGGTGAVAVLCGIVIWEWEASSLTSRRSFYGVVRVYAYDSEPAGSIHALWHGGVCHGEQALAGEFRSRPVTYYGPDSGVGLALRYHPKRLAAGTVGEAQGLRIGVVGLGTGTLAVYGRKNDVLRLYEINPDIIATSKQYFHYLDDTVASHEIVLGDARISLEQELREGGGQEFDVLIVDAFSGDAIPVHLLTREAFTLYWRHLRADGVLAVHISNHHLDFRPVVRALAGESGRRAVVVSNSNDFDSMVWASDWVLMTAGSDFLEQGEVRSRWRAWPQQRPVLWTDDFSNLLGVLR